MESQFNLHAHGVERKVIRHQAATDSAEARKELGDVSAYLREFRTWGWGL